VSAPTTGASPAPSRAFDDVLLAVADVDGWMSPDQARRLYDAAAATRAGDTVVEIGSFQGRSTIVLASGAPDGVRVVAIDPHAGNDRGPRELDGYGAEAASDHARFEANLARTGVRDRVTHLRRFSDDALDAVDAPVRVLYVDGAHRYAPARGDIRRWGAKVDTGGTMLIHDAFSSVGVTLAIARELLVGTRFRYVGRSRSLVEYRADLAPGIAARAANAGRQLAQLPWFARNLAIKVLLTLRMGKVVRRLTGQEPEWPY